MNRNQSGVSACDKLTWIFLHPTSSVFPTPTYILFFIQLERTKKKNSLFVPVSLQLMSLKSHVSRPLAETNGVFMVITSKRWKLYIVALAFSPSLAIISLLHECSAEHEIQRTSSQLGHTPDNFVLDDDIASKVQCPSRPLGSPTEGVLYFAYHLEPVARDKIIANMVASIKSLRKHSPCVKVAVATNTPVTEEALALWNADDVVSIDDNDLIKDAEGKSVRQWWTRTLYLSQSPYDHTLQIDSDRTICGDISDVFQYFDVYDFLQVPVGYIPTCDNGIMGWRKGKPFDGLVEIWKKELGKVGGMGDDQVPLARIIDGVPELKVGILNPVYQVKIIPAVGESWASMRAGRTLVLHGWAKVVAGNEKTCERANEGAPRSRIIVMDYNRTWSAAFYQQACQALLNGTCAQNELDWDLNFNVMSRQAYIKRYLAKPDFRS